jgi:hypothetical protein
MMLLILKCHSPAGVSQLTLRSGQRGRVGSSEWVELSVSESQLEPEHFVVECRKPPKLMCSPKCQVQQQGQQLTEIELLQGTTFSAGDCQFEVNVSLGMDRVGSQQSPQDSTLSEAQPVVGEPGEQLAAWWTTVEWEVIDCPAPQAQNLQQQASLRTAVQRIVELQQWTLALRLLAHLLPQPLCVGWAAQTIAAIKPEPATPKSLGESHGQLACSVQAWLDQPTEELRQKVTVVPIPLTAEEWLTQAIAWTGGSLAPPDAPEVPPPQSLCGIACATALQMHHASGRSLFSLEHTIDTGVELLEKLSPSFAPVRVSEASPL